MQVIVRHQDRGALRLDHLHDQALCEPEGRGDLRSPTYCRIPYVRRRSSGCGEGRVGRRLRWADPAVIDLARLRRDLSVIASAADLSMTALAAGWVVAQGAQPIIGARTPAEAREIAALQPIPPDLAAAAQAAADAAFTAAR